MDEIRIDIEFRPRQGTTGAVDLLRWPQHIVTQTDTVPWWNRELPSRTMNAPRFMSVECDQGKSFLCRSQPPN